MFKRILERLGHTVVTADSPNQALQILNQFQADVIICDISLAETDGCEFVRELRRRPDTRACYVVAMTGSGVSSRADASRVAGCDALLTKPFPLDVLYRILNEQVRNLETRRVYLAGNE